MADARHVESDLFGGAAAAAPRNASRPLADRLRPARLDEVVGQEELLGAGGALSAMLARGSLPSLILWGPPGVGKTTIARLLAEAASLHFVAISAVFSGVADLKRVFEEARRRRGGTLLFVDEVHRFNRAQQDGFLSVVEDGTVTLVGATTENPSFALNGALLSRSQVLVLHRLDDAALERLLGRAEELEARPLPLRPEARATLRAMADGDGRYLLNLAEQLLAIPPGEALDVAALQALLARRAALYDKDREEHFNLISALHKSMRGSDPDAALYWFARMLTGGEDPRYIARRLTRFAAEDVGAADPRALPLAVAAWETYERLGSPEGELALAQLVIYLASTAKSNAAYTAFKAAKRDVVEFGTQSVPLHLRNAPTKLMKEIGYGKDYRYDHDSEGGVALEQTGFPDAMGERVYYHPVERGMELKLKDKLDRLRADRAKARRAKPIPGEAPE